MFYVNTDSKLFILPPPKEPPCPHHSCPPEPSCEDKPAFFGPGCANPVMIPKPKLINFQEQHIDITFLDNEMLPMDLTGFTLGMAIDNNFSHSDSLIAPVATAQIVSPLDGIARFTVQCTSKKFQKLVNIKVPANQVWMEVTAYPAGSTQGFVILQDRGIQLLPKLYTHQGAPSDADPNYYNKQQVDALLEAIDGEDSDSSKGIVRNGVEDPSDSLGMPGDMYVNTVTQKVFLKGEHWEIRGSIGDPDLSQYYTKVEVDRILSDSYYNKVQIDQIIAELSNSVDLSDYYTKEEVDLITGALSDSLAALSAVVERKLQAPAGGNVGDVLTKTATGQEWAELPAGGVTSVNGQTGDVSLDAADVGAISTGGMVIETLTSAVIPAPGKVYNFAPSSAVEFIFPTPISNQTTAFKLRIAMPDPAVTVTFPSNLAWKFATPTLAAGTTSELAFVWNGSGWEGWATPDMSGFLSKIESFNAPLSTQADIINLNNNAHNIFNYSTGSGIGSINIGSPADVYTFYLRNYAKYFSVQADTHISLTAPIIRSNGNAQNTPGGFCITDATTGNLTLPGALTSAGQEIITQSSLTIAPQDNKVYKHTLAADDVFAFDTTSLTATHQVTFELQLTQPATAVTFTLPNTIIWADGDSFTAGNPAPDMSTANTEYCLVFRWDGAQLLGNLAYSKEVSA